MIAVTGGGCSESDEPCVVVQKDERGRCDSSRRRNGTDADAGLLWCCCRNGCSAATGAFVVGALSHLLHDSPPALQLLLLADDDPRLQEGQTHTTLCNEKGKREMSKTSKS